jgi:hypothetical protein
MKHVQSQKTSKKSLPHATQENTARGAQVKKKNASAATAVCELQKMTQCLDIVHCKYYTKGTGPKGKKPL